MKQISKLLIVGFSVLIISACTGEEPESLKSPCVGAEGSPCGDKRPANPHMVHLHQHRA